MNRFPKFYFLLLAAFLVFAGCSDDDDSPSSVSINEATELNMAIEGNDGGYLNVSCPALLTAEVVHEGMSLGKNYYIIDLRNAADYAAGHVSGAVNVDQKAIVEHVAGMNYSSYDNVVVICYTGQTACWAVALLRLSGVNNAVAMKYGMSAWNKTLDHISGALSSDYVSSFVTTASPAKNAEGDLPEISTGKSTGADILADRINTIEAEGFSPAAITADVVLEHPENYYIINYWGETDYIGIGHVNGAIQYTPKADLKYETFLKTLPLDKTIVVYCYTGQTSANVAAILRVMGYNAKSLLFGTNAMIYNSMVSANKNPFDIGVDSHEYELVQ